MKKLVSLAIAAILVFVLAVPAFAPFPALSAKCCLYAVPAFALEPETQVIDLGTVDLGNGVSYHTVLTIENSALRASVKKGSITRDFSYYGAAIGSVQLNGIFSYDGHTATATSASVYHTVSNGWSYGGESSWCSGNTANMSATFSKGSASVPVSATLSCSPTGALS